ncbi:serine hydrolase [Microlunatus elymi]|uniref:Serine hydrolase n=1 Tax=Microlunatus elymi TaxID=2596828 RepID=A0A516Q373_9ACTN|nr:serine hydrolase domain-containing protein [Microlunatus elymi]QDP97842.1 serine hydrolase [Microlunatus elymi]
MEETWGRLLGLRSEGGDHPLFPGAVMQWGTDGKIISVQARGWARCYADGEGSLLPESDRIAMRTDTIFDLASISKLFTSIVILQLVEQGKIDLDRAVVDYLPDFTGAGKSAITVRQLLIHTSGFPAEIPLWRLYDDVPARVQGALAAELVVEPGTAYCYSDLNLITLGVMAHRLTGRPLDELVRTGITEPLSMINTGYNPNLLLRPQIAATEYERVPDRGVVWGEVHDENAWSLGGVAGHAGVFSTAADLGKLAECMINRTAYDGGRLLDEELYAEMITNQTPEFGDHDHGLGFEINQPWYMGRLASLHTIGHTGYTGTSLVIDLDRAAYAILLTNRVHPSRTWGKINHARVIAADGLAQLVGRS